MDNDLKSRILQSRFADQIRRLKIDEVEFNDLKEQLQSLSQEWHGQSAIDKDVVADIYVTIIITLGAAKKLRDLHSIDDSLRVEEMAMQLDDLFLRCLTDDPS